VREGEGGRGRGRGREREREGGRGLGFRERKRGMCVGGRDGKVAGALVGRGRGEVSGGGVAAAEVERDGDGVMGVVREHLGCWRRRSRGSGGDWAGGAFIEVDERGDGRRLRGAGAEGGEGWDSGAEGVRKRRKESMEWSP
jgi:hypothetical protein